MNTNVTQLNFDASTVDPNFGGAGFFPVSDDKGHAVVVYEDRGFKNSQSGKGQFLELGLRVIEGPLTGTEAPLRLNLMHESSGAVAAAYAQLSAIGHVVGMLRIATTADIMNKPFRVVSELQDKTKPEGYTQLANNGIRDMAGNKPGKSGQGPTAAQPAQQMAGPQGMAGPGAPQGQGGAPSGWQGEPQQQQQQDGGSGQQPSQGGQQWQGQPTNQGAPQGGGQPNWGQPQQGQQWQGGGAPAGGQPSWAGPQGQ